MVTPTDYDHVLHWFYHFSSYFTWLFLNDNFGNKTKTSHKFLALHHGNLGLINLSFFLQYRLFVSLDVHPLCTSGPRSETWCQEQDDWQISSTPFWRSQGGGSTTDGVWHTTCRKRSGGQSCSGPRGLQLFFLFKFILLPRLVCLTSLQVFIFSLMVVAAVPIRAAIGSFETWL